MKTFVTEKCQSKVSAKDKGKKILIVDDHPIVRQGLRVLIDNEDGLMVSDDAEDASKAMEAIRKLEPDMAIVDISLNGKNGLELIKDIKIRSPHVAILALSMHDESLYAERALRAGARGYIMKEEAPENLCAAIHKVLNGQIYVSEQIATKMVLKSVRGGANTCTSAIERLSDRELEVLNLIGQGHGTRQIAEKLYLSVKTIETYRAHIKEKLNLKDAVELLYYAIQWANS